VKEFKTEQEICAHEWLRLEPYGLALGTLATRPVFLLKAQGEELILPVWLTGKAAADSIVSVSKASFTLHGIYSKIFAELGVSLDRVVFQELKGETQWVEIYFKGSERLTKLKAPADQALPVALHARIPFFATREFILSCRQVNAEIFSEFHNKEQLDVVTRGDHHYLM
jgi:bifunctional DNase/RNase